VASCCEHGNEPSSCASLEVSMAVWLRIQFFWNMMPYYWAVGSCCPAMQCQITEEWSPES